MCVCGEQRAFPGPGPWAGLWGPSSFLVKAQRWGAPAVWGLSPQFLMPCRASPEARCLALRARGFLEPWGLFIISAGVWGRPSC